MDELLIGKITHYFPAIQVAAVEISGDGLRLGDTIRVVGHTSNFTQVIGSMEIDHNPVESATAGDLVGIQLLERARVNDLVFRALPH